MMVHLLEPRNESEFIKELKSWFLAMYPPPTGYFARITGETGKPDLYFSMRRRLLNELHESKLEFWAEAKYIRSEPRSLEQVWNLLRGSQKNVMPQMAAAGITVYLVVCIAGKESWWYHLDPDQSLKAVKGKIPPCQCMYLRKVSTRSPMGKWVAKEPQDVKDKHGKPA